MSPKSNSTTKECCLHCNKYSHWITWREWQRPVRCDEGTRRCSLEVDSRLGASSHLMGQGIGEGWFQWGLGTGGGCQTSANAQLSHCWDCGPYEGRLINHTPPWGPALSWVTAMASWSWRDQGDTLVQVAHFTGYNATAQLSGNKSPWLMAKSKARFLTLEHHVHLPASRLFMRLFPVIRISSQGNCHKYSDCRCPKLLVEINNFSASYFS